MTYQTYLQAIKDLQTWDQAYFQNQQSLVSDEHYDQVYASVVAFENAHPELIVANSPTQRVGSDLNQSAKIKHLDPVLSLAKAHNQDDLNKYLAQFGTNYDQLDFIVQPKVDGATLVLKYDRDGKLIQVLSRGDGQFGNNIIHLSPAITNLVPTIKLDQWQIQGDHYLIRGEVFISKSDFQALQSEHPEFKNPRNLAAGSLNLKDLKIAKTRRLQFVAYEIKAINNDGTISYLKDQVQTNQCLASQGFAILAAPVVKAAAVQDQLDLINANREQLPYEIDGAVIKINQLDYLKQLGATNKYPKAYLAYKYPAKRELSTICNLQIDVSKTGRISYTVTIDPVVINGNTYQTINVHNSTIIRQKQWALGDQVSVYLAGDIIPQIDQIIKKNPDPAAALINHLWTNCAYCQSPIIDDSCQNLNCDERQIKLLIDQAKALEIRGLGQAHLRKCYQAQTICSLLDLMTLNYHHLNPLGQSDAKTIANILNQLKPIKFNQFLLALQVDGLANATVKKLCAKYVDLDQILNDLDNLAKQKQQWAKALAKQLATIDPAILNAYRQSQSRNKNQPLKQSPLIKL